VEPVSAPTSAAPGLDRSRLEAALAVAEDHLFAALDGARPWRGRLSESALSTATAACALLEVHRQRSARGEPPAAELLELASAGLDWLAGAANEDGGWGDTRRSRSNLPTTVLCWAALEAGAGERDPRRAARDRARGWIARRTGSLDPDRLRSAIAELYGEDRTFSIPILILCALAGVLGPREQAFRGLPRLPFELATLPQRWYRHAGLPVVSYALPALIAVGRVQHHHHPPGNRLLRGLRDRLGPPALRRLEAIQPASGGFLEAVPLTSFVVLSLAGADLPHHPVVERGVRFLRQAVRADGSWPIDMDLAVWLTTLSVQALTAGGAPSKRFAELSGELVPWLLERQHRVVHPYTGAAPGGWAWTDLPGGVPDADDTAGALLALAALDPHGEPARRAAAAGLRFLLGLQNHDGGMPTFCRGWGRLPFDRSAPDLAAHALRAIAAWRPRMEPALKRRLARAQDQLVAYLRASQRADGTWVPLWFGNEAAPRYENPTYGTARTLRAFKALDGQGAKAAGPLRDRAAAWLLAAQGEDGGWGGAPGLAPTVEETALALEAVAGLPPSATRTAALTRGAGHLASRIEAGGLATAAPIGFYFANLWYFEELYPPIFAVAALRRALAAMEG
jgi:squalene-hopene/tetraprenyl-beta-curcumene cyclase